MKMLQRIMKKIKMKNINIPMKMKLKKILK